MKDVGTLSELGVKPGDVVCLDGRLFDIVDTSVETSHPKAWRCRGAIAALSRDKNDYQPVNTSSCESWRIVSRASDKPKLWRDMTPEEKGALLLAHHEGKVIQNAGKWVTWGDCCDPEWADGIAYRVKPEPKVETVTGCYWEATDGTHCFSGAKITHATHRITFNLIDGKPDCASIKMEPVK